jgi:uncharacterized protein (DUF1684 family)
MLTFDPGDGSIADRVWLADWRRRVSELYSEVRTIAAADPLASHVHWRSARESLFRTHPQSPIPLDRRLGFELRCFDYDPRMRFDVVVEPLTGSANVLTSDMLVDMRNPGMSLTSIGRVTLSFTAGPRWLSVFWMPGYAGGLFIPFRDATNGRETYGGGRYLIDTAKAHDLGADPTGALVLDFNFAIQPSCAFDSRWVCPLAPPENHLDLPIRAGECL